MSESETPKPPIHDMPPEEGDAPPTEEPDTEEPMPPGDAEADDTVDDAENDTGEGQ
jgi:hypothetical protein